MCNSTLVLLVPSGFLSMSTNFSFYDHVTVHRNKFLYNKTNQMH